MDKEKSERCPKCIGAFSGIKIDGKTIIAGPLRCNSWDCPSCQKRLKKKIYKRILQGAIGEDSTSRYAFKFLTLTFGGKEARYEVEQMFKEYNEKGNGEISLREFIYNIMIKNFHKLIRALKKKHGNFHYFRICELHKDDIPHLHILLAGNAIIPKEILGSIEKLWREIYGMGFVKINCVKFRNKKHAISYMLKYITKDIQKVGKWKRIFSASQNSLARIIKTEWLMVQTYIGRVTDNGIIEKILDESKFKEAIINPDFLLTHLAMDFMSRMLAQVKYAF